MRQIRFTELPSPGNNAIAKAIQEQEELLSCLSKQPPRKPKPQNKTRQAETMNEGF
jgi:hypothetical protein